MLATDLGRHMTYVERLNEMAMLEGAREPRRARELQSRADVDVALPGSGEVRPGPGRRPLH